MEAFMLLLGTATLLLLLLSYTILLNSKGKPLPPGPRGWPILGNLPQLGSKPHYTLTAFARTYGPLFSLRLGRVNVVVASDPPTACLLLKTHDSNFSNRPLHPGAEHIAYNYQDMIFAPYGPRWRMLRKLCNMHLFSVKALDDFQHVRSEEMALLVRRLAMASSAVFLGDEVNVCVVNALGRAVVGRRLFAMGKEAVDFKEMVEEILVLSGTFNVGDFVPELKWVGQQGVGEKMKALHRRYDKFLDGIMAELGSEGSFLSVLVGLKDEENVDGEGGRVTDIKIKALLLGNSSLFDLLFQFKRSQGECAQDLLSAGTVTTTTTVEWALSEVIRYPDVLLKLQHELDSVVGRDRLVSDSDLPRLPYLHAVVKEVFRLHPPGPLSLPRVAVESCDVAGYHIPKNTTLLVNMWAIGRDPATWRDPLDFRPERFLPGGERPNVDVRGNDFELIPFGAGRRICAGMSLGVRMVQFLVAALAHAFEWKLGNGKEEELNMEEVFGITLLRKEPLRVYPIKRLMPSAYP